MGNEKLSINPERNGSKWPPNNAKNGEAVFKYTTIRYFYKNILL